MTRQEQFDYIIDIFTNGNITHSFLCVNGFGLNDFVCYLESFEFWTTDQKFDFLTRYLKFNFK